MTGTPLSLERFELLNKDDYRLLQNNTENLKNMKNLKSRDQRLGLPAGPALERSQASLVLTRQEPS
jgi:hypothetical protein